MTDTKPGSHLKKDGSRKLTWEIVCQIRAKYAEGGVTYKQLGVEYGVSEVSVHHIVKRKSWKEEP